MGPKAKILSAILFVIIVLVALWQFTSPVLVPSVGTKYLYSTQYANRGSWVALEVTSYGKFTLGVSIANLTFPRTTFQTSYSVVLSKLNETGFPSYVRGLTVKITSLHIQDNYDGSTSSWAYSNDFSDAAQAVSIFNFKTSANHKLMFTVTYSIYEILLVGSLVDRSVTRSYNITQNVF
jgi:hypothetical protein